MSTSFKYRSPDFYNGRPNGVPRWGAVMWADCVTLLCTYL